jgi:hypothetical protein
VTNIYLRNNGYRAESASTVLARPLIDRNKRFRHLFLFDAWRMLLSLMCADECGVVWPYFLENGDKNGIAAPDNIETLRAEFAVVVKKRRRRAVTAVPSAAAGVAALLKIAVPLSSVVARIIDKVDIECN